MWWLIGGLIFSGVFWDATRRTTVNNYNETYVDAGCEGGGGCDGDYDNGGGYENDRESRDGGGNND
jgi:hypothetical protein